MVSLARAAAVGILLLYSATALAEAPRKHLLHLSSLEMAGREVGSAGHELAREYIQRSMARAGLKPGGIDGSWFIPVTVVRRARASPETTLRIGDHVLARGIGYQLADFSDETTFEGIPLFVGYGLSAAQAGWDDYAGLDVSGRVVVAFTGAPPGVRERLDPDDAYLLRNGSKAAVALAAGAKAILFVHDPRGHGDRTEQREDSLRPLSPALPLRDIGAAVITARRATELLGAAGLDLPQYQKMLDESGPQAVESPLSFSAHFRIEREVVEAHNVVGKIPGSSELPPVGLGAHYDHLGLDGPGSRFDGPPTIHPGADDNASGVAVVLSAAAELVKRPQPQRTILFVATTGEELGLRGARQAAHVLRGARAGTYVNLDMVGRLRQDALHAYGVDDSEEVAQLAESVAKEQELRLRRHPLTDSDSDHIAFSDRGWAAMSFSTGRHADYHLPSDTIDGIAWKGLDRVDAFVADLVYRLAQ